MKPPRSTRTVGRCWWAPPRGEERTARVPRRAGDSPQPSQRQAKECGWELEIVAQAVSAGAGPFTNMAAKYRHHPWWQQRLHGPLEVAGSAAGTPCQTGGRPQAARAPVLQWLASPMLKPVAVRGDSLYPGSTAPIMPSQS